ncbi:MAG TPA: hypothetical protein VNQ77_06200 [Frankiaceae bacterium]|nr:hypothetical protein [Frankiaceae bacterium]
MKKTLSLRAERLAELTTADLDCVVGAGQITGTTCPVRTCNPPTVNLATCESVPNCPTLPVCD